MAVFSLVQISDLHLCIEPDWLTPFEAGSVSDMVAAAYDTILGKRSSRGRIAPLFYPSSFSADVAAGLLKHLSQKMGSLDALLVTGDLATSGREDDLQLARSFFDGRMPEEWNPWLYLERDNPPSLLKNPKQCIVTLPGNHDRYDGLLAAPGNRAYERHFGPHWDMDRRHASQIPETTNRARVVVLRKDEAALILCLGDCTLNSTEELAEFHGRWGQGIVTDTLLCDLQKITETAVQHTTRLGLTPCVVWAVHFPPSFPNNKPLLELIQGDSLVYAAERCEVDMILAGHTHIPLNYEAKGKNRTIPIYCCGSTTGLSSDTLFSYSQLNITVSQEGVAVQPTLFTWSHLDEHLTFIPSSNSP